MFRPTNLVFSVNGARPSESAYTLDGGLNRDTYNNVPAAFPHPDSLQEFSMLQNSYSAVYGRNVGVVGNMMTKSGTNEFHGTLDEHAVRGENSGESDKYQKGAHKHGNSFRKWEVWQYLSFGIAKR